MLLKDAMEVVAGMRFVIERMPVLSSVGRRYLYATEWVDDAGVLEAQYVENERWAAVMGDEARAGDVSEVEHLIGQVRDIEGTVDGLMGGMILGDIEFFELKSFALVVERLRPVAGRLGLGDVPSLRGVVDVLDPERTGVSAFHIYDLYSEELAGVRAELRRLTPGGVVLSVEGVVRAGDDAAAELYQRMLALEDEVRKNLAFELRPLARYVRAALREVARMDVVQARVRVARVMGLTKPQLTEGVTRYKGLWNPEVADVLERGGKRFQAVDIEFGAEPTLVSGINMGGKTVCLKTLALAQTLCQFGLYVPAAAAEVALVRRVMLVVDDNQSELSGLSSFAGEMRQVDEIIRAIRVDANVLVLVDELARTTNPVEGRAIVEAMLEELSRRGVRSFVSSHYDNIRTGARRLRVKGLRDDVSLSEIDVRKIDRYIDYGLIPDESGDVPHEALRIARLIGIDEEFVSSAEARI